MPRVQRYWTRFGLPLSILVAFCSVAVLAVITFLNTARLRDGERQVSTSHAIGEAAHRLLSALKDMQTGERGYLITGKPIFLEPFERGKVELVDSWQELSSLTNHDPELKIQVVGLKGLLAQKMAYLDRAVSIRSRQQSSKPSDEVIELVNSEGGEKLMESVRQATSSILSKQAERLQANERRSRELSYISYRAILLGNVIALAIITTTGAISYLDRRRRDQSEASLAAKESELSAIFNSTSDAILSFDNQLKIRLMNPAARQLLGFDEPDGGIGLKLDSVIHAHTSEDLVKDFAGSNQTSCEFQGYVRRMDGRRFPSDGRLAKLEADGQQYNILVFKDLTEIQRAESSRRELAAILEQVTDAIVVCDNNGFIVSWNRGAACLHGVSAEDAVGRAADELLCAGSSHTWQDGSRYLLNHSVFSTEFEISGPSKQKQWIEHRRSLIRDAQGDTLGQLVMHIDITEKRQEEARLRRGQRLESLGTLAGGVAHDLNNILTPILMNAKLAQRSTIHQASNQPRLLETIVTSAERGAKMIKKLLAFAGGERASVEPVDVRDIIHEAQEILSHSLPKSIVLRTEVPDGLHSIEADPTELSQVIINLAVNARDAMSEGGVLTIKAENHRVDQAAGHDQLKAGDFVLVSVSDQGHGIALEIQERIFDPFFTTKAHGKGTGLGLATSLGIVRAYGGDISVASVPGEGSVFSVYLPVAGWQGQAVVAATLHEEPSGRGEMILFVDDEPYIVESASELLQKSGYRVVGALGGCEAVECLSQREEGIDLVVLDMMMPDMDGIETKRRLRMLQPTLRIIGSSGLKRPQSDNGLDELDGFLVKPYANHELLQLVRRTLDASVTKE